MLLSSRLARNSRGEFSLLLATLLLSSCAAPRAATDTGAALGEVFGTRQATFVLRNLACGETVRHDPALARERRSPFSTFKIANALLALDTKVATDADLAIPYDAARNPAQAWWRTMDLDWARDHTLASAVRNSVVWYFQEIARRIGPQRMSAGLAKLSYGNRDISSGIDRFWLGRSLQISAEEQIEFLGKLHAGTLPVTRHARATVLNMIRLESHADYTLFGKTGSGRVGNGHSLGWFVGFLDTKGTRYAFALHIEGSDAAAIRSERRLLALQAFRALHLIPHAED